MMDIISALKCTKNENRNCATCKYAVKSKERTGLILNHEWEFDCCNTELLELDATKMIEQQDDELKRSKNALSLLRSRINDYKDEIIEWRNDLFFKKQEAERLKADNAKLLAKLNETERERDAAVTDLYDMDKRGSCPSCKKSKDDCFIGHGGCQGYEWHGARKGQEKSGNEISPI